MAGQSGTSSLTTDNAIVINSNRADYPFLRGLDTGYCCNVLIISVSKDKGGGELGSGVEAGLGHGAGDDVLHLDADESSTLTGLYVLEFDNLHLTLYHDKGDIPEYYTEKYYFSLPSAQFAALDADSVAIHANTTASGMKTLTVSLRR